MAVDLKLIINIYFGKPTPRNHNYDHNYIYDNVQDHRQKTKPALRLQANHPPNRSLLLSSLFRGTLSVCSYNLFGSIQ